MFNEKQIQHLKEAKFHAHLKKLEIYDEYLSHERKINYQKLNPQQHFLFKRVLHGLRLYKKEEIDAMHWDKKRRIIKVWKRSQDIINRWKQKLCYNDSNKIFAIFKNSKLGKAFMDEPFYYLPDYKNKLTLKELGIEYEHLIVKFIDEGLLPKKYFDIK